MKQLTFIQFSDGQLTFAELRDYADEPILRQIVSGCDKSVYEDYENIKMLIEIAKTKKENKLEGLKYPHTILKNS